MTLQLGQRASAFYEEKTTDTYQFIASLGIDNIEAMFEQKVWKQHRVALTQPLDSTVIPAILPPC
ncbi:hypothetical protein [Cobetia sp. QF-1]|uniref:hypothetical protein n=1 Tax=Cobetia sp. QF-1 TaxID=1969833 RepID=UPI00113186D0|nr:hypothetical protein [Cobetia sp. QF-1]